MGFSHCPLVPKGPCLPSFRMTHATTLLSVVAIPWYCHCQYSGNSVLSGLHLHLGLWPCHISVSYRDLFSPGLLQQLRLHTHQWPLPACQSRSRGQGGVLLLNGSACFPVNFRTTRSGVAWPTIGWTSPHQTLIMKILDNCLHINLMWAFSQLADRKFFFLSYQFSGHNVSLNNFPVLFHTQENVEIFTHN